MKQDHRMYSRPQVDLMLQTQTKKVRSETIKEAIETYTIALCEALIGEDMEAEKIKSISESINGIFESVISGALTRSDLIEDIKKNAGIDLNVKVK